MADAPKMPTDMRNTLLQGVFHLPENAGKEAVIMTDFGLIHGYPDLHFDAEMRVAIKRSLEAGPLGFSDTANANAFYLFAKDVKGVAFGVERVEQG